MGVLQGAGGFSGARNPEPPRNFGSDCISSGRAGRARSPRGDYGQTAVHGGSVPCSRCSARWSGSPCSAPGRANGARVPGTPPDGEVGMREERETETPGKGEGGNGDSERIRDAEGQKKEIKEKDE